MEGTGREEGGGAINQGIQEPYSVPYPDGEGDSAGRGIGGTRGDRDGYRKGGRGYMEQSAKVYKNLILSTSQTVTVQVGEEVGTGGREGDRGVWSNQPRYTRTLLCPRSGGDVQVGVRRWYRMEGGWTGVGAISQGIQEPYSVHDQAVTCRWVSEGGTGWREDGRG